MNNCGSCLVRNETRLWPGPVTRCLHFTASCTTGWVSYANEPCHASRDRCRCLVHLIRCRCVQTVLFYSLAVLDPRLGHVMDAISPFIPVLCHSDWLFHGKSCPRCCLQYNTKQYNTKFVKRHVAVSGGLPIRQNRQLPKARHGAGARPVQRKARKMLY